MRAVVPPGTSSAASSNSQRRSRAAHITAKAAFDLLAIRTGPWSSPSGVGERHVRTAWFGTGEARLASLVSKDRSYKPMVKSSGGKRESDGVVVPLRAVSNAAGGKGPDFGHTGNGGKREGMAGTAPPKHPEGRHLSPAKVRQLQNRLWAAAKQSPGRRFHALYDRIYRSDVLLEAWERVRANRGVAGVDGLTLAAVEDYGVGRMLDELSVDLRAGIYHPAPVRRVEIPKPDGRLRPLGIPTVRDRVCQQAAKIVLEPIFEADFLPCSFGFRPKRSATDALEAIRVAFPKGRQFVFEADIRNFFGEIDHERLLEMVENRVSDRRVLKLLGQWLRAGVLEATFVPVKRTAGPAPGSTTRACTSSWAPSDTRRRRNHVQKTVGKPCAGEPHARIERGMGNRVRCAGTAPLTTSETRRGGAPPSGCSRPPGARPPGAGGRRGAARRLSRDG